MKKIDVPLPEPSGYLHGDITACGKRAEARIGSRLTNGIPSEIIPVQCIQYLRGKHLAFGNMSKSYKGRPQQRGRAGLWRHQPV
jgi:hypothetical protein